jgi:hypothetical protein
MASQAGSRRARAAGLALFAAGFLGCGDRSRAASEEEYHRTVDPGLREEFYWAVVGNGTCGEGEAGIVAGSLVAGSAQPAAERCDAARFGAVAVCWDGERFRHPQAPAHARCLFVGGDRSHCREGPGAGRIWECVRTDAE